MALVLSACAGTTPAPPPSAQEPPPAAQPPAAMIPPMATMPPPDSLSSAEPMDADALRARYGAPDFVRREPESELWRYDTSGCAIFFFLYREGAALKLRYVETMPQGAGMMPDRACLAGLIARARPMS